MAYTQLSLSATPGKRYSFLAKAEAAPEAGPHTGSFTELSVTATPGKIHSFIAKTEAEPEAGDHTGLFTWLSSMGTPGQRQSFLAKTPYVAPEARRVRSSGGAVPDSGMGGKWEIFDKKRIYAAKRIIREDEEILSIIIQAVTSGLLQ